MNTIITYENMSNITEFPNPPWLEQHLEQEEGIKQAKPRNGRIDRSRI